MKKTLFALTSLAALAIAMVSCMKESNAPALKVNEKGIKVNIISDMDSKTYVQDGDIPTVYWSEGDYVAFFEYVDGEYNTAVYSEDAVIEGRKACFSASLPETVPEGSSYKYSAVYPGDGLLKAEDDWIVLIPYEQNLVNGNMDPESDVLISEPYDNGDTRIANNEEIVFNFHRLGTVVRLNLKGITPGETIKKIIIMASSAMTGYVKFDPATGEAEASYYNDGTYDYGFVDLTLNTGNLAATGDDVVWFRVFSPEDWEAFSVEVTTDAAKYTRDYIDASANPLKFINEGLTKFAVNLADYRVEKEPESIPYYEGFEDAANLEDWTFLDADGDGYKWYQNTGSAAYSGQSYLCSDSWYGGDALFPDNWAFTPAIQLTEGNYVGFWVSANSSYPDEHYGVYITLDNPAGGLESATKLFEDTIGSGAIDPTETKTASGYTFYHFYVQIPASFDNKIAYIGFRHFDCSDNYYLNLDEVSVTETIPEPEPDPVWLEDFENEETLADWTLIDADGDGFQWASHINTGTSSNYSTHSGDGVLYSQSYDFDAGALTPDNWAFTPGITLTEGNYLSFWICAQDPSYADEHYAVYITDQAPSADNLSGCTVLKAETVSTGSFERFVIAIPDSFANKTVYIGFRHFNCTDMFYLNLDDVAIYDTNPTGSSSSTSTSSVSPSSAPRAAFAKGGKKMASSGIKKNTDMLRKNK